MIFAGSVGVPASGSRVGVGAARGVDVEAGINVK
jgi:hypothetical protein